MNQPGNIIKNKLQLNGWIKTNEKKFNTLSFPWPIPKFHLKIKL